MPKYFPILLDLENKKVLVVGGGPVACRKVKNLLEFGIGTDVIAPDFCDELLSIAGNPEIINLVSRKYKSGDSQGYYAVFAATSDIELDRLIREDCIRYKALLNVADEPELCSFILPATIKKGSLTVSVGTQGLSPFFSKAVKEKIESALPVNIEKIAEIAGIFRNRLLESPRYADMNTRFKLIDKFNMMDWEGIINREGFNAALEIVDSILENT